VKQLHIKVEENLHKQVRVFAADQGTSVQNATITMIEMILKYYKKKGSRFSLRYLGELLEAQDA